MQLKVNKIGHIGIGAKEAQSVIRFFTEALGGTLISSKEEPEQQLISNMVQFGDCCLEIMETTTPDGVIGKFVAKRGPGLHHISLKVEGIEDFAASLEAQDVRIVGKNFENPSLKYMFIDPRSTGGVLVEMVESAD